MQKSDISKPKAGSKANVQRPKEDYSLTVTIPPFEFPDICLDRVRKLDAARIKAKDRVAAGDTAPIGEGGHALAISLSDIANNQRWPDISELSAFQAQDLPSHLRNDIQKMDERPKQ